jgi:Rieske Fe-S protein
MATLDHEQRVTRPGPSPRVVSEVADGSPARRRVTRRTFIVGYLGALLAVTVAAVTAPLLVYLYPPNTAGGARVPIAIPLDTPLDAIPEGGAVQFKAPRNAALVMTDGGGVNAAGDLTYGGFMTRVGGQLRALAITCPHLGCSYALDNSGKRFLCPCHGSQFSLTGQVLHGPAMNPLSHLAWRPGEDANTVLVDGLDQSP